MNITITLVIPALEMLLASGGIGALAAGGAGAPAEDAKPASRTRKPADKTPPAEPEAKTEDAKPEQDEPTGPSLDDVKAAAKKYNAAQGRDAMAALIEKYGGTSVSTIAEDKRQAFIDEIDIETA